jgi:hypothetical protein
MAIVYFPSPSPDVMKTEPMIQKRSGQMMPISLEDFSDKEQEKDNQEEDKLAFHLMILLAIVLLMM